MRREVIAATAQYRHGILVRRDTGEPITTGTVNYYLYQLSGANAGKWWDNTLATWSTAIVANACTHLRNGAWYIQIAAGAWENGGVYIELFEESTGVHIPFSRLLVAYVEQTAGLIADAVWDEPLADHTTAGSTGKKLGDLPAFTVAAIADGVWDEPLSEHTAAGSTGKKLNDLVNVRYTYNVNITLKENDNTGAAIVGAYVFLFGPQGQFINWAITNTSGQTPSLTANNGTYTVKAQKIGTHVFDSTKGWPQTLVVNGADVSAEYYGVPVPTGGGAGGNVCQIYGWVSDVGLAPLAQVEITFTPLSPIESGDYYAIQPKKVVSGSDGSFGAPLIRLQTYEVTFVVRDPVTGLGTTLKEYLDVPNLAAARYIDYNRSA